ncbi:endonuclease/exonuclease/phosphatase family protein [Streptomyces albus]|uniref:endonuclease/exonuclease/phosphatase family protein n=1 Tax=Streptomyces albus TaxID=1888 RepID=UPI0004C72F4C|nr:endonuclease/exonuclease/phosphatase family protein [Streptomyces albus]
MAGAVRSESDELNRDGFTVVRRLAERIAEERPQFVAVQEVCGAQFERLKAELDKRAHPMAGAAFVPDKKSDPRCPDVPQNVPPAPGGKGVGKAVLSRDAAEAAPAGTQLNVCLRQLRETSGGPVGVCSVHTDDKVVEGAHGNRIPPLAAEAKKGGGCRRSGRPGR